MTEKTYHFIGIGGIGMSGLAKIMLARNHKVTGSDIAASAQTMSLEERGAKIAIGHDESHVMPSYHVIVSSDIPHSNPELEIAKKYGCTITHRAEFLRDVMQNHKALLVAGTHGKTTTTSLLIHTLKHANWNPGFAVGGMLKGLNTNAEDGTGDYFIAEADESDASFLLFDYEAAIITNVDTDHLVHYGSWDNLKEAFRSFINKGKNQDFLFFCQDDLELSRLATKGIGYGFSQEAALRASRFEQKEFSIAFDVTFKGKSYEGVSVPLSGVHNALNALAVFGLCLQLGLSEKEIRDAFCCFPGVRRRMDKKGDLCEVLVVDDYAHHPTEVKATLKALRGAVSERRIVVVFQPHRYSRMQYSMYEFQNAFQDADVLIVTDLYTAEEIPIAHVSTQTIMAEIAKVNSVPLHYIPRHTLVDDLYALLRPHDVVITLGAGDVTKVGPELVKKLEKKAPKKLKVGLLFGGMNCEHEVSCVSVKNFFQHLRRDLYDVVPIQIGLDGHFRLCNDHLEPVSSGDKVLSPDVLSLLLSCDLFIPVLHGPFGEDGSIAGFLETLKKPYVGCDLRSSAVSMDKVLTKMIAESCGIKTAKGVSVDQVSWERNKDEYIERIGCLQFPLFVKPAHLGSSVGVSKVKESKDLLSAVERAFQYDTSVIVEEGLTIREIEFAVLGNSVIGTGIVRVPPPGELLTGGNFYHYDAKYGQEAYGATAKAALSEEKIQEGRMLAEKIYRKTGCQGLARVDFFLDSEGTYYFNEINPMPGFTPNSLYPKIWQEIMPLEQLIDKLIILAQERALKQERIFQFSCKNLARE